MTNTTSCPRCGTTIDVGLRFCPRCGTDVTAQAPPSSGGGGRKPPGSRPPGGETPDEPAGESPKPKPEGEGRNPSREPLELRDWIALGAAAALGLLLLSVFRGRR